MARLRGAAEEAESGRGWRSRPSFSAVSGGGESPEPPGSDDQGEAAPGQASPRRPPSPLRTTCQDAREGLGPADLLGHCRVGGGWAGRGRGLG